MVKTKDIEVSLQQLILDPNNYRLFGEKSGSFVPDNDADSVQKEVLSKLEEQRLGELKDSIKNNGFLEMERIVVRLLDTSDNKLETDPRKKKYLVVEGNRRTAALKVLAPDASGELKAKLQKINVILIEGSKEEIKKYSATLMGIRHVSGPKKWDGFQSAKLINDLYIDGNSFTNIAEILGITNREAGRRYRGYQAFEQMRLNAKYGDKVEPRHYGLLLEFLSPSKEGKSWLGWNDAKYMFENSGNLEIVYRAITHDEKGNLEIKNPGDARKFVSLISTQYVTDIEQGISIHDMPDPADLNDSGKLKRIKSFISFIDKNSFNTEETDHLNELKVSLEERLGN